MASLKNLLGERASALLGGVSEVPNIQPPVIHEPLQHDRQQIRLVKLHASCGPNSLIECTLYRAAVHDYLKFTALSHPWGDASITTRIIVNKRPMQITTNLASALRHIIATGVRPVMDAIWADAICINQTDTAERNHQVRLMAKLYSTAPLVLSWMGPEPNRGSLAFGLAHNIANTLRDIEGLGERSPEMVLALLRVLQVSDSGTNTESVLESMRALQGNSLFSRGWVFQESYLARNRLMILGLKAMDSQDLARSMRFLSELHPATVSAAGTHASFLSLLSQYADQMNISTDPLRFKESLSGETPSIASLLILTQKLQVSDPRDKIYCLLGMARENISVDYDLPATDLYCRVMREWANRTSRLTLLQQAGLGLHPPDGPGPAVPGLPSWVPDWHYLSCAQGKMLLGMRGEASKEAFTQLKQMITSNHLLLAGTRLSIGALSDQPICFNMQGGVGLFATTLWRYASQGDQNYPATGVPRLRALFDAFQCSHWKSLRTTPGDEKYLTQGAGFAYSCWKLQEAGQTVTEALLGATASNDIQTWFEPFFAKQFLRHSESPDSFPGFKETFARQNVYAAVKLLSGLANLYFFTTENGHFGFSPCEIQNEDIICLIRGCSQLLALRKVESHFVLVGSCWVYGFMDGEAEENLDDSELEVFEIR